MAERNLQANEFLQPDRFRELLAAWSKQNGLTWDPQATAPATTFDYDNDANLWGNIGYGPLGANFDIAGIQTQNVYVPGYFGSQKPVLGHPPVFTSDFFRGVYLNGFQQMIAQMPDFDRTFQYFLDVSVGQLEAKLGLVLYPRVIITDATERGFRPGIDFDWEVREQDFVAEDFFNWGWNELQHGPVMQIQNMNFVYPTGQEIMNIPMSWVKPQPLSRQIRLVPPQGALSRLAA